MLVHDSSNLTSPLLMITCRQEIIILALPHHVTRTHPSRTSPVDAKNQDCVVLLKLHHILQFERQGQIQS